MLSLFVHGMQPERILGGEYGIHSEVWSLGVSVLEVSTVLSLLTLKLVPSLFTSLFADIADGSWEISLPHCKWTKLITPMIMF